MVSAIIVAAGIGQRMNERLRKQYLLLKERPILDFTLAAISSCKKIDRILLVVAEEDFDFCRQNISGSSAYAEKPQLVAGGASRQESVYNGLKAIEDSAELVVIHDGVRPFVRPEQVEACIDTAEEYGACVLGIPVHDTLKSVKPPGQIEKTVARDTIWLSQTPQAFRFELIKKAHDNAIKDRYTGSDDASLVERLGETVRVILGSKYNIKITNKEDLLIAQALLNDELV